MLVTRRQLTEQLAKIINLPQGERVKAFRLPVSLLGVADKRRRKPPRSCRGAARLGRISHAKTASLYPELLRPIIMPIPEQLDCR
ncbi:DUF5958 family protein [Streptomyces sp. NBC_01643]|uniref:DUF5958 family protein n=1 Tax=Streptomyces sp. NBC_01643 TaxID=2975906 RepID=UPI0038706364